MTKNTDPRRQARILFVQELYAKEFPSIESSIDIKKMQNIGSYDKKKYVAIKNAYKTYKDHIDKLIIQHAPERPLEDINKVDLAILRMAIAELFTRLTPIKVVIDEAVEIAKIYGTNNSYRFINGVLGSIINDKKNNDKF